MKKLKIILPFVAIALAVPVVGYVAVACSNNTNIDAPPPGPPVYNTKADIIKKPDIYIDGVNFSKLPVLPSTYWKIKEEGVDLNFYAPESLRKQYNIKDKYIDNLFDIKIKDPDPNYVYSLEVAPEGENIPGHDIPSSTSDVTGEITFYVKASKKVITPPFLLKKIVQKKI